MDPSEPASDGLKGQVVRDGGADEGPEARPWWARVSSVNRPIVLIPLLIVIQLLAVWQMMLPGGPSAANELKPKPRNSRPAIWTPAKSSAIPEGLHASKTHVSPLAPTPPSGYELFVRNWLPGDDRCHGGDGLGPLYNEASCLACHGQGGVGGSGPLSANVNLIAVVKDSSIGPGALSRGRPRSIDALGSTLHRRGTSPAYAAWRAELLGYQEGREPETWPFVNPGVSSGPASVRTVSLAGVSNSSLGSLVATANPGETLRLAATLFAAGEVPRKGERPMDRLNSLALLLSRRNPPPLFGSGVIDAISDREIVANGERSQRASKDVTGRPSRTRDGRIGRFGWKAQIASLGEFVASACAGELGLEVPGHHQVASPLGPPVETKGLDMTQAECDSLTGYLRRLPIPEVAPMRMGGTAAAARGRELFETVGCAACHTPDLGDARGIYSDLLLHDMGFLLADDSSYYSVEPSDVSAPSSGTEWRTPPLWGLHDSGPYLHDGRARTIEEAIDAHGGEALGSTHRYDALSWSDRERMETFLLSLVAPCGGHSTGPTAPPESPSTGAGPIWVDAELRRYDEALHDGLASALAKRRATAEIAREQEAARVVTEAVMARAVKIQADAQAKMERNQAEAARRAALLDGSDLARANQAATLYQRALAQNGMGDPRAAMETLRLIVRKFSSTGWDEQARRDVATLERRLATPTTPRRPHR